MTSQHDSNDEMKIYEKKRERNLENRIPNDVFTSILVQDKKARDNNLDYDVFGSFKEYIFKATKNSNGEVNYYRCLDMVVQAVDNRIKYKHHYKE